MRILFDQGTPVPLRQQLTGHSVDTTFEKGWSHLRNGELLQIAEEEGYELLLTTDQNLPHQQNLAARSICVLVLLSTSWPRIQMRIDDIRDAIGQLGQGEVLEVPICCPNYGSYWIPPTQTEHAAIRLHSWPTHSPAIRLTEWRAANILPSILTATQARAYARPTSPTPFTGGAS